MTGADLAQPPLSITAATEASLPAANVSACTQGFLQLCLRHRPIRSHRQRAEAAPIEFT